MCAESGVFLFWFDHHEGTKEEDGGRTSGEWFFLNMKIGEGLGPCQSSGVGN